MATTPDVLRRLREPWFTRDVPLKLQGYVRFAARLMERGGRAHVVRYVSGGAGTIIEERIDEATRRELKALIEREYLAGEQDEAARLEFQEFLASRGVDLTLSSRHVPPGVFDVTRRIVASLPADHLGHERFRTLELGGWGHGAAKCSEHDGSTVHMFSFAVKGPVRNYAALFMHETGHAHFAMRDGQDPRPGAEVHACLAEIGLFPSGGRREACMPFAIDYLLGPASRAEETLADVNEFAAETYLMYVAWGLELKRRIASLPPGLEAPWRKVYDVFKESFGGVEYE